MARSLRSALATALEDNPDGGPSSATVSSIALFQMSVSKYCTSQHKHATMPVHYEYPVRNGTDILSRDLRRWTTFESKCTLFMIFHELFLGGSLFRKYNTKGPGKPKSLAIVLAS